MGEAKRRKAAGEVRLRHDELQGMSFGGIFTPTACAMTDLHVRASVTGRGEEGTFSILLLTADTVEAMIAGLPSVISALREEGGDRDVLPPPSRALPGWDQGTHLTDSGPEMDVCVGLGVKDIVPELGAAVMFIGSRGADTPSGEIRYAEYYVGWSALLEIQAALPKVLEKLKPYLKEQRVTH